MKRCWLLCATGLLGCGRTALGEDFVIGQGGADVATTGALSSPGANTHGPAVNTGSESTGSVTGSSGQVGAVASATGAGGLGGLGGFAGTAGAGGACDSCAHSWGEPTLLETADGGVLAAEIAMNDAGAAVVAWSQSAGVWATLYTPSGGWAGAELLGNDGVDVDQPKVAIDDEGAASVTWSATQAAPNLRSRRYTVSSGWEEAEFVNPDGAATAYTPDVAMDANGTTLVVWNAFDGTHYDLWSRSYTRHGGWASAQPVQLESDTNAAALATNRSGNTLVVWSQSHEQQHHAWASRSEAGTDWTTPEMIQSVGSELGQEPDLAIDPEGNGVAVWHQYRDGSGRVWTNRFSASAGWGTPELLGPASLGAYFPRVGMDGAGNAVAVWRQSNGPVYDIWSNRYSVGSGWGTPELVSGEASYCHPPEVAVGAAGDAVAVWAQADDNGRSLWANRYIPGAGWGDPEFVDVGPGLSEGYDVAVDGTGNALVVWSHSDGRSFDLWGNASSRPE